MEINNSVDYNVNVSPLLAHYNNTNNRVSPLIFSDDKNHESLANIRGSGLYNPAPSHIQTTDRGHALSNIDTHNTDINTNEYK